jgi:DNA-binding LacI/PurR family transcriptional regulator
MTTMSRPTLIDVARAAGVSVATVSNALNGRPSVDPATRERVKAIALGLGYSPNLRARRLRTGRADTIALFSSMSFAIAGGRARMGFMMQVAAAAAVQALNSGLALVLVPPLESKGPPLDNLQIDGALVIEPVADDPGVRLLKSRGIPVVAIGRQLGADDTPYVDIRSHDAAMLMLEHLRAQSARRIALMIGSQARTSYSETERAYRDFAATQGMMPLICRLDEDGGEQAARAAALSLLRDHPDIDAFCAPVDAFAVGIVAAARDLGRRIPDDLLLVTRYDGRLARESSPPLTALDLHLDETGTLATELLLEHIQGNRSRGSACGVLPILLPRRSSLRNA